MGVFLQRNGNLGFRFVRSEAPFHERTKHIGLLLFFCSQTLINNLTRHLHKKPVSQYLLVETGIRELCLLP